MGKWCKFIKIAHIWVTHFGYPDISLGLHLCFRGRIDIHFLFWMISIGVVPIYEVNGKIIAVSNSFHSNKSKLIRERSMP